MKTVESFKNRFETIKEEQGSESGMEAAQVILILVLVVVVLIPVLWSITSKLKQRATNVGTCIDNVSSPTATGTITCTR